MSAFNNNNNIIYEENLIYYPNDETSQQIIKKPKRTNKKQQLKNDLDDYMKKITQECDKQIDKNTPKKQLKYDEENFTLPKLSEYNEILKYKYGVEQLKSIAKSYNLKIGGNKNELIKRIYYHMFLSLYIIKIQKIFRGFIQKKYNKLHGPAFFKREICTNTTDFFTMEELNDIPYNQFYSYTDTDNHTYGFDIVSLYNLITKTDNNKTVKNPYNRSEVPSSINSDIKSIIRYSKLLNLPVEIEIKSEPTELSPQKSIELKTVEIFQKIDALGNYSNPVWFLSLNRLELIKLLRELQEIWTYRAQITNETKFLICPPNGDPFRNVSLYYVTNETQINNIQKVVLEVFEKLINSSSSYEYKCLGAIYILGSITLVNQSAANALPWLYQSFCYF